MAPALIVLAIGVDPSRALVISQVVLSFGIPFALVPLLLVCRDRNVMGPLVNARVTTIVATVVAVVIIGLNVFLLEQTLGSLCRASRRRRAPRRQAGRRYALFASTSTSSSRAASSAWSRARRSSWRSRAATTMGQNCVPAWRRSSARAALTVRARRYGRVEVMASKASATRAMRASMPISAAVRRSG